MQYDFGQGGFMLLINIFKPENTTNDQALLFDKIKNFGLSPDDWHMERIDSKYLLTHLENNDFQFIGYSTPDSKDWQSLHLYSL